MSAGHRRRSCRSSRHVSQLGPTRVSQALPGPCSWGAERGEQRSPLWAYAQPGGGRALCPHKEEARACRPGSTDSPRAERLRPDYRDSAPNDSLGGRRLCTATARTHLNRLPLLIETNGKAAQVSLHVASVFPGFELRVQSTAVKTKHNFVQVERTNI